MSQTEPQPQIQEQDFSDIVTPIENGKPRPQSTKALPQSKLLVGGGLVIFLVVALVVRAVMGNGQTATSDEQEPEKQAITAKPDDGELLKKYQNLKVQQALGDQEHETTTEPEVESTGETTDATTTAPPTPAVAEANPPQRTATTRTSRRQAPQAAPRRRRRFRATPEAPVARRTVLPQARPTPRATPAPVKPSTISQPAPALSPTGVSQETVDPFERYERMRAFAQFSNKDQYQPPQAPTTLPVADTEQAVDQPIELLPLADIGGSSTPLATLPGAQTVQAGTRVKAKLMTSAAWTDDVPLEGGTVLGQLQQPLGALPKNTILTFKVETASQAGFLILKAQSAAIDGQDIALPDGLTVTGKGGKPLQAKQKANGRGIKLRDVLGLGLAGLGEAAEFINRPRNSATLANDGISQTITDNRQGSVAAAIGKGLTDQFLDTAKARTQQIQSRRAPYWFISSGSTIQIMVTTNATI